MKKGICITALAANLSLEEKFAQAAEYGFDGVELLMGDNGTIASLSENEDLDTVKTLAERYGMELYSVTTGVYWVYSFGAENPAAREKAMEYARKQIDIASYLGCNTVLIMPGTVSVVFSPQTGIVPYDVVYERTVSAFRELAVYAREKNVHIGIENVWNNFLLSPLEMRNLIDEIGDEYVGAYFDVGNVLPFGHPEHWIRILGSRIKKVHFKDFKRSIGNINGFCDLLEGDVDYPAVIQALKDIGYDDWVSAETSRYKNYNEIQLQRTSDAMDRIING